MHICSDELRWLPFLLPFVPVAIAYGKRAWDCACGACAACLRRLSRKA